MNYKAYRYKIKAYIKSDPTLYKIITFIRNCSLEKNNLLCSKDSDLCVESYPSSANSFLCRVLKYSNKDLNIGQHTHSIANIKIALKYNIPVITIIRDPLNAISSRVVRFDEEIEKCIFEYIAFYEYVAAHLDDLVLLSFENVINNTSEAWQAIIEKTALNLICTDLEEASNYAFSTITSRAKELKRLKKASLPSEERENQKEKLKKRILQTSNFQKAEALYKRIADLIT